eukprot:363740-Chlamydomonas_euryale.AAC.2
MLPKRMLCTAPAERALKRVWSRTCFCPLLHCREVEARVRLGASCQPTIRLPLGQQVCGVRVLPEWRIRRMRKVRASPMRQHDARPDLAWCVACTLIMRHQPDVVASTSALPNMTELCCDPRLHSLQHVVSCIRAADFLGPYAGSSHQNGLHFSSSCFKSQQTLCCTQANGTTTKHIKGLVLQALLVDLTINVWPTRLAVLSINLVQAGRVCWHVEKICL